MNSLPNRNRDLAVYVWKKRLVRTLLFLLWVGLWIGGALLFNDAHQTYPPERRMVGWRLAALIGVAILSGLPLFRIPQMLLDKSFSGVILSRKHTRVYTATGKGEGEEEGDARAVTVLRLQIEKNRKKRFALDDKPGIYFYYYEGTRVQHFSCLPYPIADPNTRPKGLQKSDVKLESKEDLPYICAVCGHFSKLPTVCGECGHSLIDPSDLFKN